QNDEQRAVADVGRLREHAGEIDAPLGEPARQVDQEVSEPPGVAEHVLGRAASPPPEVPHEVQRAGYGRHGPSMGCMLCNYAPFVHPPSAETQERSTVYAQGPRLVRPRRARPAVAPHPGAVPSFAYEKPVPAVDTNVSRVLRRVFFGRATLKDSLTVAGNVQRATAVWGLAGKLVPKNGKRAWQFNQAMMELGALICVARKPKCPQCPVRAVCRTGKG